MKKTKRRGRETGFITKLTQGTGVSRYFVMKALKQIGIDWETKGIPHDISKEELSELKKILKVYAAVKALPSTKVLKKVPAPRKEIKREKNAV